MHIWIIGNFHGNNFIRKYANLLSYMKTYEFVLYMILHVSNRHYFPYIRLHYKPILMYFNVSSIYLLYSNITIMRYIDVYIYIFFPIYFYGFLCICTSAAPQRPAHSGQHPRWLPTSGLTEFSVCWGGAGFEPRTTDLQSGALPLSHLSSYWATSPPDWATSPPIEPLLLLIEPPLLLSSHLSS